MNGSPILLDILIFLAAFLYSSVGHGGASGYLAIMALFQFEAAQMRPTALIMNLVVSCWSFIQFKMAGFFNGKIFWPIAVGSIPASFLGGAINIPNQYYRWILGVLLALVAVRFLWKGSGKEALVAQKPNPYILGLAGLSIGFLSGLIGIGGGVLLSPILLLMGWAGQKQTAAISALFIFVNSFAGLLGQWMNAQGLLALNQQWLHLVLLGLCGSILGSWLGARVFKVHIVKLLLSIVLLIAAFHLLWK